MRIDLHIHTKERSVCGKASEAEQVVAAIDAGLDAIAFTDHGRRAPAETIARLNEAYAPFRIYGGIEIGINGEDLIVLGIDDADLETTKWSYPALHAFSKERGGFLALAHPYRYRSDIKLDMAQHPPDAIEMYSPHTPPDAAGKIFDLASRLGIPVLSNSDAHSTDPIGEYCNLLYDAPADERELVRMLREGRFTAVAHGLYGTTAVPARSSSDPSD